ncbi:hypothetical protein [Halobaculum sp. MBLA0143]|uniref:hypothetical protein n=1 Tax=Halobaculum sp. MBLA0143 TaxID=3079933 RepID=UPI003525F35A
MQPPIDPTATDPDATALLDALPSEVARRRVVAAADVGIAPDADNRDARVAELDPPARRRVAEQIRFTGHPSVFYRRIPGLDGVDLADATSASGFGGSVQTTLPTDDGVAAVCSVPETGAQARLGTAATDRVTTVVTARPDDSLVAVRAPDRDTATETVRTLGDALPLDDWARPGFDADLRDRLADHAAAGYTRAVFDRPDGEADRVTVRAEADATDPPHDTPDVFADRVTRTLLEDDAVELHAADARLAVDTPLDEPVPVTLVFGDDAVRFERFVPEATRAVVDGVVRECL